MTIECIYPHLFNTPEELGDVAHRLFPYYTYILGAFRVVESAHEEMERLQRGYMRHAVAILMRCELSSYADYHAYCVRTNDVGQEFVLRSRISDEEEAVWLTPRPLRLVGVFTMDIDWISEKGPRSLSDITFFTDSKKPIEKIVNSFP